MNIQRPQTMNIPRYASNHIKAGNTVATVGLEDKATAKLTQSLRDRVVNTEPVQKADARSRPGSHAVLVRGVAKGSGGVVEPDRIIEATPPQTKSLMSPSERRADLEFTVKNRLARQMAKKEQSEAIRREFVRRKATPNTAITGASASQWLAETEKATVEQVVASTTNAERARAGVLGERQARHFPIDTTERPTVPVADDTVIPRGKRFIGGGQTFSIAKMNERVPIRGPGDHGRLVLERERRGRTYDLLAPARQLPEWDLDYVIE